MRSLDSMRALVTGASQGIGLAVATALAKAGTDVCLAARREDVLRERVAALGARASYVHLDLANAETVDQLSTRFSDGLDVLIHCGGRYAAGTMADAKPGEFEKLLAVNVAGTYELTRRLLPAIVASHGQVVFMNSSIVSGGGAGTGQFAATAHALRAVADSLRAEVNSNGVRVLSVFPGRTATPRQARIFADESRPYEPDALLQPEDIADTVVHALCLPDTAEVTEVFVRPARNFAH